MFLVVIHELWHFFAAKKSWVHVHEFGVGIPPKVTKLWKDKKGTEYTINWIPLWWFVRLKGEDPSDPETFFAKDSFITTSLPKKIFILLGWVVINALFAWLAFSTAFFIGTKPITIIPDWALLSQSRSYLMPSMSFLVEQWLVQQDTTHQSWVHIWVVMTWWLAESLWIIAWSRLLTINGQEVTELSIWKALDDARGGQLLLEVMVPESWEIMTITWDCPVESCLLWVWISWSDITISPIRMWLWEAMVWWLHEMYAQASITLSALWTLWNNLLSFDRERISWSVDALSWPVWIVAFWQQLFYNQWWLWYLWFSWIISLALALFNILPIPALDGWRIVSVLIQALWRFSPSKYFVIENYINVFFFVLLMLLWLFIIYKDILMINTLYW